MKVNLIPPSSKDSELACLAAALRSADAIGDLAGIVTSDDFYYPRHAEIMKTMVNLFESNSPVDMVTVSQKLADEGKIDSVGGPVFLASLSDVICSPKRVEAYAETVKAKAKARRLIAAADVIKTEAYIESGNIETLLSDAEKAIFDISNDVVGKDFVDLRSMIDEMKDRVYTRAGNPGQTIGVPTGFVDLDQMILGLIPQDLIIIAGRPSMGKTALALNIVRNVAIESNLSVAMFSLEMSKQLLSERLLASVSRVNGQGLRTGFMNGGDDARLEAGFQKLSEAPIFFDDTGDISVLQMRAKARRLKAKNPDLALIVVDYLQLMKGKGENRNLEISEISRSLKIMAKDLDVPVLALSQLNRGLESRTDKRPMLSDLRESGAIEQDADVICFIYRDEVYNKAEDNPNKGIAEIIIGKQRNGPTGTVKLAFLKHFSSFENLRN